MPALQPVIVGGNGHSGTRIFIDVIEHAGVFCGIRRLTKRTGSSDLRMIDLLNRWSLPFVRGTLTEDDRSRMRQMFARRLRLLFPFRSRPWGFKNPRTMLILPVLHELFPGLRFVHVIRDGRDMALGNVFARQNHHVAAYLGEAERALPPEQQMILFWGRSNEQAMDYGMRHLGDRYAMFRWEDLCAAPADGCRRLLAFSGCDPARADPAAALVRTPSSIGRWKSYPADTRSPVERLGEPWLRKFGYLGTAASTAPP